MSAEQAFRDSLNSFQLQSNSNSGGSWFSRLGFGRNTENEEATQSLLGNIRSRANDGLSSLGFGNNEEEDNPFGLSRFQRYVNIYNLILQ